MTALLALTSARAPMMAPDRDFWLRLWDFTAQGRPVPKPLSGVIFLALKFSRTIILFRYYTLLFHQGRRLGGVLQPAAHSYHTVL